MEEENSLSANKPVEGDKHLNEPIMNGQIVSNGMSDEDLTKTLNEIISDNIDDADDIGPLVYPDSADGDDISELDEEALLKDDDEVTEKVDSVVGVRMRDLIEIDSDEEDYDMLETNLMIQSKTKSTDKTNGDSIEKNTDLINGSTELVDQISVDVNMGENAISSEIPKIIELKETDKDDEPRTISKDNDEKVENVNTDLKSKDKDDMVLESKGEIQPELPDDIEMMPEMNDDDIEMHCENDNDISVNQDDQPVTSIDKEINLDLNDAGQSQTENTTEKTESKSQSKQTKQDELIGNSEITSEDAFDETNTTEKDENLLEEMIDSPRSKGDSSNEEASNQDYDDEEDVDNYDDDAENQFVNDDRSSIEEKDSEGTENRNDVVDSNGTEDRSNTEVDCNAPEKLDITENLNDIGNCTETENRDITEDRNDIDDGGEAKNRGETKDCSETKDHDKTENGNDRDGDDGETKDREDTENRNDIEDCNETEGRNDIKDGDEIVEHNDSEKPLDRDIIKERNIIEDDNKTEDRNDIKNCNERENRDIIKDRIDMEDGDKIEDHNNIENCNEPEDQDAIENHNDIKDGNKTEGRGENKDLNLTEDQNGVENIDTNDAENLTINDDDMSIDRDVDDDCNNIENGDVNEIVNNDVQFDDNDNNENVNDGNEGNDCNILISNATSINSLESEQQMCADDAADKDNGETDDAKDIPDTRTIENNISHIIEGTMKHKTSDEVSDEPPAKKLCTIPTDKKDTVSDKKSNSIEMSDIEIVDKNEIENIESAKKSVDTEIECISVDKVGKQNKNTKNANVINVDETIVAEDDTKSKAPLKKKAISKSLQLVFMEQFKKDFQKMTRNDLEELVLQKLVETIVHKSDNADMRKKIESQENIIMAYRNKISELSKQFRDLEMVHNRIIKDLEMKNQQIVTPVKITRAVGLQVCLPRKEMPQLVKTVPPASSTTLRPAQPMPATAATSTAASPATPVSTPTPPLPPPPTVVSQQQRRRSIQRSVSNNTTPTPTPSSSPSPLLAQRQQIPAPQRLHNASNPSPNLQQQNQQRPPQQQQQQVSKTIQNHISVPTSIAVVQNRPNRRISGSNATPTQTTKPQTNLADGLTRIPPVILKKIHQQNRPNLTQVQTVSYQTPTTSNVVRQPIATGTIDLTDEDDVVRRPSTSTSTTPNSNSSYQNTTSVPALVAIPTSQQQKNKQVYVIQPKQNQSVQQRTQKQYVSIAPKAPSQIIQIQSERVPEKVAESERHPAPLPAFPNQVSKPNWKRIPPRPIIRVIKMKTGIVISWTMDEIRSNHAEIASYQIFAYQETDAKPSSSLWRHVGDVKAMVLPMAVTLTQFQEKNRYFFAVRAYDEYRRFGVFSIPRTWADDGKDKNS